MVVGRCAWCGCTINQVSSCLLHRAELSPAATLREAPPLLAHPSVDAAGEEVLWLAVFEVAEGPGGEEGFGGGLGDGGAGGGGGLGEGDAGDVFVGEDAEGGVLSEGAAVVTDHAAAAPVELHPAEA